MAIRFELVNNQLFASLYISNVLLLENNKTIFLSHLKMFTYITCDFKRKITNLHHNR